MTIVEALKTIGGLNLIRHQNRWLFWSGEDGMDGEENVWVVREKRRHKVTTLISTQNEDEAVEVLLNGVKK